MPPFDLVITSPVPRTIETAIAMRFAVDDTIAAKDNVAAGAMQQIGHHERWSWDHPWVRFAEMARAEGFVADYGRWLRDAWAGLLESLPDGDGCWSSRTGGRSRPAW